MSTWHSTCPEQRKVYHDHKECTEGRTIEARCMKSGTGGYRKCEHCEILGR
jgi:hypothetical protein